MAEGSKDKSQLSILALFAHPDDEAFGSGGTLAGLVRKGHRLTVVCVTNGDVGEISDPALATPENLWQVRQEELRQAMAVTGIQDVRFLGLFLPFLGLVLLAGSVAVAPDRRRGVVAASAAVAIACAVGVIALVIGRSVLLSHGPQDFSATCIAAFTP